MKLISYKTGYSTPIFKERAFRACYCFGFLLLLLRLAAWTHAGNFSSDFNSALPANTHLYGGTRPGGADYPAIDGGVLKLTYAFEGSERGSMVIAELDGGQPGGSVTAKFNLVI